LAESLAPFEMVLRGSQETNARLQQSLNSLLFVEEQLRRQNRELVSAHQAVEKQRSRYRALFDFAPDGYLITGVEGAIREANTAAATLLRTPKELLPGQSLAEFVVTADREIFRKRLRKLHQGVMERIENWQLQIEPRNGPPIPAVLTVVAERSAPATADLRWLLRDDTERKRLEKERTLSVVGHARAKSARRFEFLAEASSLLVGSLDLEGSLVSIAQLTAAFFGGWCFINVIESDKPVRQLEVAHADFSETDLADDLRRHCLFSGPAADRAEAWFSGPKSIEPLNSEWCDQIADGPEHAVLLRRSGRRQQGHARHDPPAPILQGGAGLHHHAGALGRRA
jgi:PAS domain S-box-containing protein